MYIIEVKYLVNIKNTVNECDIKSVKKFKGVITHTRITRTCICTYTHTYTHVGACAHTHTYTHTHTQSGKKRNK
jgi:hypothetical protein